jgi:protein-S-isoprenylcysteine O-methyltransferase Ste14
MSQTCNSGLVWSAIAMLDFSYTHAVFVVRLIVGITLNTLMVLTFVMAILDWSSAGLVDLSRLIIGLPLFLVGFGITLFGYFNLGFGNTYCGEDGLVSHSFYRFSLNPQYASSILGLIRTVIMANSWLTIPLAFSANCVYVLMALTEEVWLEDR